MGKVFIESELQGRDRGDDDCAEARRFRSRLLALESTLWEASGVDEPFPYLFAGLLEALRAAKICAWYWSRADDSIQYLPADGGGVFCLGPDELPQWDGDFLALVHAQDRAAVSRIVEHARRAARAYELQYRVVDKAGVNHVMRTAARPVLAADGRHLGDVGTCQDVTALKHSEDARRLSEERYALAVEGSHDGIWDWGIERDEVYFSPRLKEILGLPQGDGPLSSRQVLDMIHPADRAGYSASVAKHLKGLTRYFKCEVRMVRPDGQIRWIFGRGLALRDRAGQAYRVAGSVSDVTERKETERQLVQAQKMEAVGQLTGGLAHDFNNILGVVLGNLDMVRDAMTDDDRQAAHIDSAIGAAERGASLTKRLLAFSRKQTLAPEPVDVGKVVVEMLDLLRRTLGETIAIEIESQDGLWVSRADRAQLESAILNLAINSRDAMLDGGILRIETVNRRIDQAAAPAQAISAGDYVRLMIADSGAGMTPETLERVFEPFFTTKGIGKGTGLGLAMVHGFVQQSDGHIAVSSVPGRGTTVEILLPRCESVVPGPGDARSPDCQVDRRGAEAPLVVEDDKPS